MSQLNAKDRVIVALDRSTTTEAMELAASLQGEVGVFKVGLELVWAEGPAAVESVRRLGPVFVDAKLHDIPNTVEHAAENIARLGAHMLTVHSLGGEAMMAAAVRGAKRGAKTAGVPAPLVIAITVLSSQSGEELASPASLAFEAQAAGVDGVVVSGDDVKIVRDVCGADFTLVVPGIRPLGSNGDDQVRILTPSAAVEAGADYLVVGRPITASPDPRGAARAIVASL